MSAETTVTVSRNDDGRYTAVDAETGAFGEGESKVDALADLLELLQAFRKIEEASSKADVETGTQVEVPVDTNSDPLEQYERLSDRIQQRVRDEDVDEAVVEDAIEWARSR
jgi:molybdenum-dependent DNA-binding transcriptional regulator ModE